MAEKSIKSTTLDDLLKEDIPRLSVGDTIEGTVMSVKKSEILIDLGPQGVGFIPRREASGLRDLEVGSKVNASIIDDDFDGTGQALLSIRKAAKDKGWDDILAKFRDGSVIEVVPYDANRGGLVAEFADIKGFIPVSQLSPSRYPRTSDRDEIMKRLATLLKQPISVKIIDADKRLAKLIFSEKEAIRDQLSAKISELDVGDIVKAKVTGATDFGVFVNVDGLEGLVHVSELSWGHVADPTKLYQIGEEIDAKVVSADKDRLALSVKQLTADPWIKESKSLKVGDEIKGAITRTTPFGAFVQVSPVLEALVSLADLGAKSADQSPVKVGETHTFRIASIDPAARRLSLKLVK